MILRVLLSFQGFHHRDRIFFLHARSHLVRVDPAPGVPWNNESEKTNRMRVDGWRRDRAKQGDG